MQARLVLASGVPRLPTDHKMRDCGCPQTRVPWMTASPELWPTLLKVHCPVRTRLEDPGLPLVQFVPTPSAACLQTSRETEGKLAAPRKSKGAHGSYSPPRHFAPAATVPVGVLGAGSTHSSLSQREVFLSFMWKLSRHGSFRAGLCYLKQASSHGNENARNRQV